MMMIKSETVPTRTWKQKPQKERTEQHTHAQVPIKWRLALGSTCDWPISELLEARKPKDVTIISMCIVQFNITYSCSTEHRSSEPIGTLCHAFQQHQFHQQLIPIDFDLNLFLFCFVGRFRYVYGVNGCSWSITFLFFLLMAIQTWVVNQWNRVINQSRNECFGCY